MRTLKTRDISKVMQILKIAGVSDTLSDIINMVVGKNADANLVGGKVFALLFDLLGEEKAEVKVYALLADIAEKTPEEISNQSLEETKKLFKDIAMMNDLKSFFKSAVPTT